MIAGRSILNLVKRALTALLFSVSLVFACGGGQDTSSTSSKDQTADKDGEEEEVSSKGKKWGGWRWKGKRNDCFFVVDNECFAKLKKACRKAKCGKAGCEQDDGAPAEVTCKKK